jgi:hypothetical protein
MPECQNQIYEMSLLSAFRGKQLPTKCKEQDGNSTHENEDASLTSNVRVLFSLLYC